MSIEVYPKHQYAIEISSGELTPISTFIPSFDGYIKHMRVKMLNRNFPCTYERAKLVIMANASMGFVCESDWVNYADIGRAESAEDYWHSFVRFDFAESALSSGSAYLIGIYQENYNRSFDGSFVGYCLDYNYPINQTSDTNHPFTSPRLAAEIYLLKDYYDFS